MSGAMPRMETDTGNNRKSTRGWRAQPLRSCQQGFLEEPESTGINNTALYHWTHRPFGLFACERGK